MHDAKLLRKKIKEEKTEMKKRAKELLEKEKQDRMRSRTSSSSSGWVKHYIVSFSFAILLSMARQM